ncbi:MAG TPA: hypothetical protein VNP72_07445 [Longimicrobium sp.]|nr:hypothetical protein [Longimicrobium sp.]
MSLPVVSFLFGILLIATAVLGGGFEIREIKIPKVGAVARTAALLIGAVFVGIGLRNPNAKVPLSAERDASAANHLAGPGAPRPGDSTRRDTARQAEPARPEPPAPAPRLVDQEQEAPAWLGFRGLHGSARLSWNAAGVPYIADVTTNGEQGIAHVAYMDPSTGTMYRVVQDLRLHQAGDLIFYAGSNPRHPDTGEAVGTYFPDNFRLARVDGGWTFDQTCDSQPVCSPVQTETTP